MNQLVRSPTRGDRILDLVLTNLPQIYDKNGVEILPPFGLSDHNVVLLHPKVRSRQEGPCRKVITKRDTRISRKLELGRYLNSINWSIFDSIENCELPYILACNVISILQLSFQINITSLQFILMYKLVSSELEYSGIDKSKVCT